MPVNFETVRNMLNGLHILFSGKIIKNLKLIFDFNVKFFKPLTIPQIAEKYRPRRFAIFLQQSLNNNNKLQSMKPNKNKTVLK